MSLLAALQAKKEKLKQTEVQEFTTTVGSEEINVEDWYAANIGKQPSFSHQEIQTN